MRRDPHRAASAVHSFSADDSADRASAHPSSETSDAQRGRTDLAGGKPPLEIIASGWPLPDVLHTLCGHLEATAAEWERREAALRRSEAFLAQAQRLTRTGSAWWKPATGEIVWSDENYRVMEYPLGVTPTVEMALHRCHPDDLSHVREKLGTAVRDGATVDFEHRLLMPNGAVKHVRVVFQNIAPEGSEPEFLGATTDITEWKLAEERLRQSEAYLAEAQRLSSTGNFCWRVGDERHRWSDETFRIFGYDRSTPITMRSVLSRVHPEDLELARQLIVQAEEGRDIDHEYRLLMPDGSVKHVHVVAHGVRGGDGRLEVVGALQDVSQKRRSEEVLGDLRSELARVARVASIGVLTAAIAHEVNQPLSSIVTNGSTCLRMLAAEPPNIEGARLTARRVIRDAGRASTVIGRLRALFARKPPSAAPVDLNDATLEVLALMRSDLRRGRVLTRVELADDLPHVIGDRVQLQQVIMNLIRNAIDAMSDDEDHPKEIVIGTAIGDTRDIRLSVRDSGCGLAQQEVARLFDDFYTTKAEGMGIGLSVSRSIIESHGGRLWASPNQGRGSTFAFAIPLPVAQEDATARRNDVNQTGDGSTTKK